MNAKDRLQELINKKRGTVLPTVIKTKGVEPLTELEQRLYEFVKSTKFIGTHDIPIVGATTVEMMQAFPDIKSSYLRYTMWHLRKKGKLIDKGLRRADKGKVALVVWQTMEG